MQTWNQWGSQPAAGYQGYQPPPTGAPPPPAGAAQPGYPMGYQYYGAAPAMPAATPDMSGYTQQQWSVVQQQHWQQWQQWQQQFQQWQQQYGDKYQESLNTLTAQNTTGPPPTTTSSSSTTTTTIAPAVPPPPDMAHPPPLPPPDKSIPPPPPEDSDSQQQQDSFRAQSTASKTTETSTAGGNTQDAYNSHNTGTNFPPGDRSNPPPGQPPLPYYGVPPPSKGTLLPTDDFNKPPPPPPTSNYDGGYGNRGNSGDNFQSSKRPYEGGDKFRDQFSGGDDSKKPRTDGFGVGYPPPYRSEDQGSRGRGRGGRWGGSHSIEDSDHRPGNKLQSEGNSTPQPVRPPGKDNPDELSEAEKAFDVQFKQWEEQFNKWKEQNINHPDKTQYREYEAKWESWREQLLQRREQMRKKREASQKLSSSSGSEISGENFQSDSSGRGGRGRGGRGRGNFSRGSGRGGSNMSQDDYRGMQDASNRATGSFGGSLPHQDQNFMGGFREQKLGPGGSGDFGGYGMSQPDHGGKAGPEGSGQRPLGGGPNLRHDNFVSQHGFGAPPGPVQDSKMLTGPVFGGSPISKQESKIPLGGPNRGSGDFGGPLQGPPPLGGFTVPPPNMGHQDTKGMPTGPSRNLSDLGVQQKPPNLLSPGHGDQFTSSPKSSTDDKKIAAEGEKQDESKNEQKDDTVKLDFMKKTGDGIPGLDLLSEENKNGNSEKAAAAEERELSVGHDVDERSAEKPNNSDGFIGPMPAPNMTDQANDADVKKLSPVSGSSAVSGPPDKPQFPQTFGPDNQSSPKEPFSNKNKNFGAGSSKVPGNENQPNQQNFGNNPPYGPNNQSSNQPFDSGNQGGHDSSHIQGFGPMNNMGQRSFGPEGNRGFGPNNQGYGGGNQGPPQGFGSGPGNQGPPGMGYQSNNQGFPPNNFGMQGNQGFGSRQWNDGMEGPNRGGWNQGPNRFDAPGKDGAQGMRNNFQGSRDNFQGSMDGPKGSRDNFQGPRDNFFGQRDNFQGPRDGFQGPRDNFQGPRDNFQGPGPRDNFQGPGPRDNFQGPGPGPRDNFQGPGPRDNFQGPRDNFHGSRDGFQGMRENFQGAGSRDVFQGLRDNFSGPGDRFHGPRDNFPGSRDNFQGQKDRFSGPPFGEFGYQGRDFPVESEFGRGGPHDFQESGRGMPQDFGSEFGRGRGGRGRGRGRGSGGGNFGPPQLERGHGDEISWQRGGGRGSSRFGPGPDDQRILQPDTGPVPQTSKGPGSSYGEDIDIPPVDKSLSAEGAHPPDADPGKWDRGEDGGFSREPFVRRFDDEPPSGKNWGDEELGASRFPRENRFGDYPKSGWGRSDERQSWDRPHDWDSNYKLEPATVVDYGHKPVSTSGASDSAAIGGFVEPVQTFDYGHGASSRRSDIPADSWRREDLPYRSSRDREEKFHRERDRERDRDRDRERDRERDRDRDRDRERERDREKERERERERSRERDWGRTNWEQERDYGKRDSRWERERERDRGNRLEPDERSSSKWDEEDRYRNSGGERWSRRDRERDGDRGSGSSRYRESSRNNDSSHGDFPPPPDAPPPPSFTSPVPAVENPIRAVLVEDLLCPPGRTTRPARLVIMLRGPPGSGKTFVAKLIKDKEVEMGGSAPRILALDDYFMVEVEKEEKDPETGRKVITKVMEYEYEAAMEKHYRSSLLKAFRKTVNDGYFPFIIVDCVNHQVKHFEEMWSYAKQKGFQVYVCEMDMDASACTKRNIHNRTEEDIADIIKNWEETPRHYLRVDVRSLLQSVAITEVEMEDTVLDEEKDDDVKIDDGKGEDSQDGDEEPENSFTSKWERMEPSGDKLNRLDGLAKRRKTEDKPQTLEDWLQLTDDYDRRSVTPGKKRVRWADLEERREQEKMRAIGFVVGQTDWSRMTDPTFGESALTQTKYI